LVVFFVHGLVFSTWVSRIPAVQAALGVSTGELGFALLGVAVGSLISMPLAGWLISRYGSKPVTVVSSLCFCCALAPPALAGSAWELGGALAGLGLTAGAMDVAMNAQGVAVERLARKPVMSGFHAMFSLGGMAGSGIGGVVAKAGVQPPMHFTVAALVYLVLIVIVIRGLLPASTDASSERRPFRITPVIAGLGAICFCLFLSEGAIADWSALYLSRILGAGPVQAAAGYALFSGAMAVGRIAGDGLRARFGPVTLVRNGSLLAAGGLSIALVLPHVPIALAGFTLVGFGCSIIVPIAFAAGGNLEEAGAGSALAAVVAAGYFGLFVGPPAIGLAAEAITLRWALFIVVGLCLVAVLIARVVRRAAVSS
jgi:MFS family permease